VFYFYLYRVSTKELYTFKMISKVKVKVSRYTPWRHMGGEEV
jgi:hypothetical protein